MLTGVFSPLARLNERCLSLVGPLLARAKGEIEKIGV